MPGQQGLHLLLRLRAAQVQILHQQMHGRTPLGCGQRSLPYQKARRFHLHLTHPADGTLGDLLIQLPALQLGGRDLGGNAAGCRVGIVQLLDLHRAAFARLLRRAVPLPESRRHGIFPHLHLPSASGACQGLGLRLRPAADGLPLRGAQ